MDDKDDISKKCEAHVQSIISAVDRLSEALTTFSYIASRLIFMVGKGAEMPGMTEKQKKGAATAIQAYLNIIREDLNKAERENKKHL